MSMKILRPGLLTSIQDLGRVGYQKYGVIMSGAMDPYALRVANLLVGNDEGEAALEITLTGPSLKIEQDILIAITGGELSPTIENKPIPLWKPVYVKKGSVLQFGPCISGCRTYLAIAGGIDVEEVMGSCSTYLRAGIGGFHGRALEVGDVLEFRAPSERSLLLIQQLLEKSDDLFSTTTWSVSKEFFVPDKKNNTIRVILGSHYEHFTKESKRVFFEQAFTVTPQSDRMGYRLSGDPLELTHSFEMISEAVSLGTIQVPPDGNPIILLADRQTTGGYPRIGQVASVDISLLAQVKPGERIQFKEVSVQEAEETYLNREKDFKELRAGLNLKFLVN
ncbi:5-oxoprolinase subunit C family protein [Halalkalibacter alkalisediminis]|uniref:Biotin-dependent carboxyltransferase family protein n=1 Tax=Halalkalibacter alkalisediminis TaxID=935616 RepID=A0ABV6NJC5_9BACI|nr:biotin-dependent carboxyltransferase family protein [Halalkalibacter alkalisediminis]